MDEVERVKPRALYVDEAIQFALESRWSEALAVNAAGQVVGWFRQSDVSGWNGTLPAESVLDAARVTGDLALQPAKVGGLNVAGQA